MSLRDFTPAALAASLLLTACGGGGNTGGGGGIGGTGGTMRLSITDAPACGYDTLHVTIERVRVHQSASAADGDAGWSEIVLSPARRIDLLTLTNGTLADLGEVTLPAGRYTQVRLVLADNAAAGVPANAVRPTGSPETALTTPSAQQPGGLKLAAGIDVTEGQVAEAVLDFDACKSIVRRGTAGQYNLKPVISVIPVRAGGGDRLISSQRVTGYLDPSIAAGASVSMQLDGVPVKATVPDPAGRFVLYPVPVGTYDLVVTAPGRAVAVVSGVPVSASSETRLNDASHPVLPPTSSPRAVTGRVQPPTATVRALQTVPGGPAVEVAWGPVDAGSGDFDLSVPVGLPVRAVYARPPAMLDFAVNLAGTPSARIDARSDGARQTLDIDPTATTVPPANFSFP
ncbi:DUF4382 domain-containing protein [Piscinibacter gummiphilus]|uniref:Uncharacterized protein n=1 Tax=Piscinibacter gummiphilus TaxID=946333 RepID=A0A1W6LD44_9BURK|nr:DUF4382 domain-containing protein [Piscinibacter gummiphilus]ARN22098.1 hypothetical protein A4W93_20560 [Piscinibacter gummiphilus]ATU66787.1 hypothetical protein CPZ87_20655 [Piscinibacter gummiphilus]GLS94183.1 lipoprotein [Piscinibacter gummiphilus]